uniref:U2A'/phosphoprotein 32 family A C-terminal domain-containing protein n=1 Tax=Ditylenchus dipsaci TaxID=166011 RepID=A0A915D4W2_9BILA
MCMDIKKAKITQSSSLETIAKRFSCTIITSPKLTKQLVSTCPILKTLALTNNEVTELVDVDSLAICKKLEHLTMVGNPVTHKPNYRLYVIYTLKTVRVLDFQRIKDKERVAAKKLFKPKKTIIHDSGTKNLPSTDSAAKQLPNSENPALKMSSSTDGQAMEVSINDEKQIGGSATVVSGAAQMDEYEEHGVLTHWFKICDCLHC